MNKTVYHKKKIKRYKKGFVWTSLLCYVVHNNTVVFQKVILLKGPQKWTFFETCLLHVFYQFLTADYKYNIFRMLKKCYDDFLEG